MSGKQMEGDNQRRRTLARQARERGRQPSEAGVTLGSGKQFEHREQNDRDGPPPAGRRKPAVNRGDRLVPPPPTSAEPWPLPDPAEADVGGRGITYRALVSDIGRRAGMNFDQARVAAEATVAALARALDDTARERLLDAVPSQLHGAMPPAERRIDLAGFLNEVARISQRTPEQARYQVQATLSALAEQDRSLLDSLDLPPDLRDLSGAPPAGGGVVDPASGRTAALTDEELRTALAALPYWSGDRRSLCRTLDLPPENLDRVLGRLARLRPETGRGPRIGRQAPGTAVLVVRTGSPGVVTALDVTLAHQIDDAIDEVGAGMAS